MTLRLKHLNADTSWLITFNNFNILIDPWLFGAQTDFFRHFSTQKHAIPPCIQSISHDLNRDIHAVIISHEFTDHCHEETLRSLSNTIPIFATTNAYKRIQRWNYFLHIYEIPILNDDLIHYNLSILSQRSEQLHLPDTISVGYLPEKGFMALPALHGATCIAFLVNHQQWSTLLYIPHGCKTDSITDWFNRRTNVTISVLLQGFDRVYNPIWLGGLVNYGCEEAAQLALAVKTRYWIATHDEDKIASGLVAKFLKRKYWKISNAQTQLQMYFNQTNNQQALPLVHEIPNGESLDIDLIAQN